MSEIIARHATDDLSPSRVSRLRLYSSDVPTPMVGVGYNPMLCLVTSGAKHTLLGDTLYTYGAGDCLIVSAELPVRGSVIAAPYRALSFDLNPAAIAAMMLELDACCGVDVTPPSGIAVTRLPGDLTEPLLRLLRLLDQPDAIAMLAPMIERELLWRLLQGPYAPTLRQIGSGESRLSGVSRAVRWLRGHYAEPVRIEALADMCGMSLSTFHRHFRTVTTMTPLQFQKHMRLDEARSRMIGQGEGAAEAGFAVGYDSPSQFSREYARRFGLPPARDAARLRDALKAA